MTNRRGGIRWISRLIMGVALGAVVVQPAAAQSTIFNIPTTDTVSPGKYYFEFDYVVQLPKPDFGQFQIFGPRGVVGITPQLEAGVNIATAHYGDDGGNFALFQPNAKYKFYSDDDRGLAAAAGIIAYIPINNRDVSDTFGQIYANISKKFKSGARVHGGIYGALDCDDFLCDGAANKVGALLGYEQPLAGRISFVADWFTGKNPWGYFTPGISVTLPRSAWLKIGYSIGNDSFDEGAEVYRNRALFVYYGITLP